jgi:hypothetical protein
MSNGIPCPIGYNQPYQGQSFCDQCSNGTVASREGSRCEACPAGESSLDHRQCYPCQPGRYSLSIGSSRCDTCKIGTFAPLFGQKDCFPCPLHQYTISDGSTSCIDCINGLSCQDGRAEALPGYWAWLVNQTTLSSDVTILRFDAIKCLRDRCKGGPIIDNRHHTSHQCDDNRDQSIDNILCGRCENDHYIEWGPSDSCIGMFRNAFV